jgi:hypothetical protein
VLRHSCYNAHLFLLQCSIILVNSVIPRCYSIQPFFTELQSPTMLSHFSELSHFSCYTAQPLPLSYNAQPFSTATVLSHLQMVIVNLIIFCYSTQSFYVKDRRGDQRGGVNGSQSKFLTGTWPISLNRPDIPLL